MGKAKAKRNDVGVEVERSSRRRKDTGKKTGVKTTGSKQATVDDGGTKTGLGVSMPARDDQPVKSGLRVKVQAPTKQADDAGPKRGRGARRRARR